MSEFRTSRPSPATPRQGTRSLWRITSCAAARPNPPSPSSASSAPPPSRPIRGSPSLGPPPSRRFLGGLLRLTFAENPGAFLSLGGNLPHSARFWLFITGVGLFLLGTLLYLVTSPRLGRLQSAALALLVGGGLSNWFDRLVNDGRVVDFMLLGIGPLRTGVFNVADIAIMLGAGLLVLAARRENNVGAGGASQGVA